MLNLSNVSCISKSVAGIALPFILFAGVTLADAFDVQPARLSLSAKQPTGTFNISNPGPEERTVKFDVMDWSQDSGVDRLSPGRRLIVHPRQLTLKAGDSKTVRVGVRLSTPKFTEEAYRLLVSEVPSRPDVGAVDTVSASRGVVRRASLPVFVLPPGDAQPRLLWRIERNSTGAVELKASNRGTAHVQVNAASLLGPSRQTIRRDNIASYLLPGQDRSWPLADDAPAGVWQLTADTNAGLMRAEIKLVSGNAVASARAIGW